MTVREKKLTVRQATDLLGLGRTTIYSWIKEGRLRSETTPRGKLILLNDEEEKKIREITNLYSGEGFSEEFGNEEEFPEEFDTVHEGTILSSHSVPNSSANSSFVRPQDDKVMLEMLRTLNTLNDKLLNYSEQAGQVKLLADSENKTKEEYFKTIQENAVLKANLEKIQKENEELKKQLEKKNTFFGFKLN